MMIFKYLLLILENNWSRCTIEYVIEHGFVTSVRSRPAVLLPGPSIYAIILQMF